MRKLLTGILAIGIFLGVASASFAGLTKDHVRGKVISVDYKAGKVVVFDDYSKMEKTFTAKRINPGVAEGVRVLVIYKSGTNQATLVKPTKK